VSHYSRFITVLIIKNLILFVGQEMVENLHAVWIKIDETLPWIELKGTHETRKDAREAAKNCLRKTQIMIVTMAEKRELLKAMATIRR
jgi:hypothetical protein